MLGVQCRASTKQLALKDTLLSLPCVCSFFTRYKSPEACVQHSEKCKSGLVEIPRAS